jgi:hypothetical protein
MTEFNWSQISDGFSVALCYVVKALNSSFGTAAVGALAGAYAGAIGAQHVAERSKRKDSLTTELNTTNSAIMLSFVTCNAMLGLKKQIVGPLYEGFLAEKAKYIEHRKAAQSEPRAQVGAHTFSVNLITFSPPLIPIETLKTLVLQRISAYGKATSLVSLIENAAAGLVDAVKKREEIVSRFKSGEISEADRHWHYFGEKTPSGQTHREHSDIVEVIHDYVNDLIYFSAELCEALVQHGKLAKASLQRMSKATPSVNEPDFSGPKNSGLFPPASNYASWQGWIVEKDDKNSGSLAK